LTLRRVEDRIFALRTSQEAEMSRKTKKMAAVEDRFHQPLEKMLPTMVTDQGLTATAEELGVSKATLGYWLLKLRIDVRRVALAPGETLEVKRVG
jgi:hypothetical protein